ncbi:MAG TPA: helix-turn-helix transcriptional regulator [Pseudogracilibacillus sp.]|nr:helix-turn-helix transcriptional regulator [Pseudogracilibacillus sp.]
MTFGEYIKSIREKSNLSLREVARRSEISHPYLSQLENGKNKRPTHEMLRKLSKGLKVDYLQLLEKAGYINEAEHYKRMARVASEANKKTDERMKRIKEDGNIINPESFPQPNTIQKTLNVPTTYMIDGNSKEFSNDDILTPYNYFSLALDKNELFPLINNEGKQISKDEIKKILILIDTILK